MGVIIYLSLSGSGREKHLLTFSAFRMGLFEVVANSNKYGSQMQDCLNEGQVPEWMVLGRTVLVIREPDKGNLVGNYHLLTCLPLLWTLFTGISRRTQ